MAKQQDPPEALPREPGRFVSAWSVLRGQRLTPLQVQHEWLTYKQVFDDVLNRLGAQLARQQKLHGERLKQLLAEGGGEQVVDHGSAADRKDALRQRFAQSRGLIALHPQSSAQPVPPEESP